MDTQVHLQPMAETAFRLFQLGLFAEAETAYRSIIERARGNSEAWNMLGITLQRQGRTEESIQALQSAMEFAPRAPEVVVNLANLFKESGDLARAIRFYRKALALAPEHVDAHANLANCLVQRNETGDLEVAETHALRAQVIDKHSTVVWSALANIAECRRDFDRAVEILESAVKINPDNVDLLLHLGSACMMARRGQSAVDALQHALKIQPQFVEAMNNLGQVLFDLGQLEAADEMLQEALRLRPEMVALYINLANVQIAMRSHADALESLNRIFDLDPDNASAHFLRSLVLLVEGDFANGWDEYAWRWRTLEYQTRLCHLPVPEWHGEDLAGKSLFVYAEQGSGDTLQFVRYLPMLEKNGGQVIFEVQPLLKRLLTSVPNIDLLMAKGESLPHIDFHVPLLNIPGILGTSLTTIPGKTPYISAVASNVTDWSSRVDALGLGLKVGIAWAGNPDHANDRNRSIQLERLAPLADTNGVKWISLQKGLDIEPNQVLPGLIDWTEDLHDFADTAALIANLDLVISVDTSVAHLAGALGTPVWVMIPFSPDWRWLLDRTDSLWYPTMRLFRQSERGNWEGVIGMVIQELQFFTNSASSRLT